MRPDATPAGTLPSRRRALCVGINAYSGAQQLTGAVADTMLWKSRLTAQGFDVTVLLDRDATASAILNGVRALTGSSRVGDVLVFAFSGCGAVVPDPADGHKMYEVFLPVNYRDGEAIMSGDFASAATLPPEVTLTCFFDCCFQGAVTGVVAPHTQDSSPRDQRPRFVPSSGEWRSHFESRHGAMPPSPPTRPTGIIAFSACTTAELAWEKDGQGEFTRRAAGLLAGGIPPLSNRDFHRRIVEAFGPTPQQTPTLDAGLLTELPFLGARPSARSDINRATDAARLDIDEIAKNPST